MIHIPHGGPTAEDWIDVDRPTVCRSAPSESDVTSPLSAAAAADDADVLAPSVKSTVWAESPINKLSSSLCSLTLQCNRSRTLHTSRTQTTDVIAPL